MLYKLKYTADYLKVSVCPAVNWKLSHLRFSIYVSSRSKLISILQRVQVRSINALNSEFTALVFFLVFNSRSHVNYKSTGELEHTLNITKPTYVFISSSAKEVIPKLKQFNYVKRVILLDDDNVDDEKLISFKTFLSKYGDTNFDVERFVRQPVKLFDQVAMIFMSSGTTGLPKG